jgi:hypothetical protein
MGWGQTEDSENGSDVALEVDTEVISNAECNTEWGGII